MSACRLHPQLRTYGCDATRPLYRAEQVSVGIDDQAAEHSVTVGVIEADQGRETVIAASRSPCRRVRSKLRNKYEELFKVILPRARAVFHLPRCWAALRVERALAHHQVGRSLML